MKVTLIDHTGFGHSPWYAAEILIFTKSTRLAMKPSLLDEIKAMSEEKKMAELEYMSNTIPSSWEFVEYTFLVEGVSRAYTHQQVRTRHGSYAQQTLRMLDASNFDWVTGPSIKENVNNNNLYDSIMLELNEGYKQLIAQDVKPEDARGILPTNICTNIVCKFNLRTLAEMASKRASGRTQDEYREVIKQMIDAVKQVHPWSNLFLRNRKADAAAFIERLINEVEHIDETEKTNLLKQLDILRN